MRALIISTISLLLFISIWGIFDNYSKDTLKAMISSCENDIMPAIQQEDWDTASRNFTQQYQLWHDYRQKALYMLETDLLNKADEGFAKALMYIDAKDLSNSSGELLALQKHLTYIHQSESLTLRNIL